MELDPLFQLALAVGLGLLVGLQREYADKAAAGVRTFALITLFGTLCAQLGERFGGWPVGTGLLGLCALFVVGNLAAIRADRPHPGITTEVAALVMFGVGALIALGETVPALVVAGGTTVLLQWKRPLHDFAGRIGEGDMRAILRLALVALVILPALPDASYGPYGVLNPFDIWRMVVLIVGISMIAYVAYKLVGGRKGVLAAGLLGGLISSTATTLSQSRDLRGQEDGPVRAAGFVIAVASTVVFGRVLFEVAVVSPQQIADLAPPLLMVATSMVLVCGLMLLQLGTVESAPPSPERATSLVAPIVFGLLYAAVLVGVSAAREHFGAGGLYVVSALSGLTDVDAITLSISRMMEAGQVSPDDGWRLILVGVLANLAFKAAMAASLGGVRLLRQLALPFGVAIITGVAAILAWPH